MKSAPMPKMNLPTISELLYARLAAEMEGKVELQKEIEKELYERCINTSHYKADDLQLSYGRAKEILE